MRLSAFLAAVLVGAASLPAAASAAPSLCDAVAGNLVANCGFESGTFAGWTTAPAPSGSYLMLVDFGPTPGNYKAIFGTVSEIDDAISQVLATAAGQQYELSYNFGNSGFSPQHFAVSWNGTVLSEMTESSAGPSGLYQLTVTGTGSDTLRFAGYSSISAHQLDDIVVVPTAAPEPASLAVLAVAVAGLLARRRPAARP